MATSLERWLEQAERKLSRESKARVRAEIQDHYESAREGALREGASDAEADRSALAALGDPEMANREYRKVMITAAESRLLRESNCEARLICSRPAFRAVLLSIPAIVLGTAITLFASGMVDLARTLLMGGVALSVWLVGPFLPVYTPSRARVYRVAKWTAMGILLTVGFGPLAISWSWLLLSCLWPFVWIETARASIRRKLPVSAWPKQLYL